MLAITTRVAWRRVTVLRTTAPSTRSFGAFVPAAPMRPARVAVAGDLKTLFAQYAGGGAAAADRAQHRQQPGSREQRRHEWRPVRGLHRYRRGSGRRLDRCGDYIDWKINVPTTGSYKVTTRSASMAVAGYAVRSTAPRFLPQAFRTRVAGKPGRA